jgi:subtilisin family serine protease
MRSRPVALVLAIIAVLLVSTSAGAAGPPSAIDLQPVIVVFEDSVAHPATEATSLTAAYGARPTFTYSHALKGFAATLPAAAINALRANPNIRWVEPDGEVTLADTTQTPATWGLDRVDQRDLPLSNSYTYAATGSGVQAYVIDSGIKFDHVDFGVRATLGADFIGDGRNGVDCNGHGTHVAGTIGGQVYGVAKGVSLIAVRTHDCAGNSTWSKVIAGVDFVTGQKQANPGTPMVANMSIQGSPDAATDAAVANSISAGVSYAVAAGNGVLFGGDACNSTPARVAAAMTVGATDSSDARAFYSNYGSCVDWFGPGSGITSDGISSTTATAVKDGTSMAAPHTAGVAALYLQGHPNATPQEVRDALFQATTKGKVTSANSTNNHLLYSLFAGPPPPVLTTITVSPATASVQTSGTQQFTATGLDQSGQPLSPQPTFTWSVSGGGTISTSGLFTAGSTTGPFTVTATSGSVSGTASVTVTAPPILTTITVSPASASVQTSKTQQFTATGRDQNGTAMSPQPTFTWSVSGGGTISAAGLFTAGTTAGGPFTVTASSGSVSGTASVAVTSAPPDFSLSVSPTSQSVKQGNTATYTVTVMPKNGFTGSVTLSVSGQPSGSTVTFTPNPTTTTSTMKVQTVTGVRGTFTLTITGVSGSLSHTTTATLKVTRL